MVTVSGLFAWSGASLAILPDSVSDPLARLRADAATYSDWRYVIVNWHPPGCADPPYGNNAD